MVCDNAGHRSDIGRVRIGGVENSLIGMGGRDENYFRQVHRRRRTLGNVRIRQELRRSAVQDALDEEPLAGILCAHAVNLGRSNNADGQSTLEQHQFRCDLIGAVPLGGVEVDVAGRHGGLRLLNWSDKRWSPRRVRVFALIIHVQRFAGDHHRRSRSLG